MTKTTYDHLGSCLFPPRQKGLMESLDSYSISDGA